LEEIKHKVEVVGKVIKLLNKKPQHELALHEINDRTTMIMNVERVNSKMNLI
jgi:hypothetical protein